MITSDIDNKISASAKNLLQLAKIADFTIIDETSHAEREGKNTSSVRTLYATLAGKVFLVENAHTVELRTDAKLGKLLQDKYETVMRSRYFGKGGIEIVPSGQLDANEVADLVRLSYEMATGG